MVGDVGQKLFFNLFRHFETLSKHMVSGLVGGALQGFFALKSCYGFFTLVN